MQGEGLKESEQLTAEQESTEREAERGHQDGQRGAAVLDCFEGGRGAMVLSGVRDDSLEPRHFKVSGKRVRGEETVPGYDASFQEHQDAGPKSRKPCRRGQGKRGARNSEVSQKSD